MRAAGYAPTYFIADAEAKPPWNELMRGSIEALYDTYDWGPKVLDIFTTSFTARPHLSAIKIFLRHTGREDAPGTGQAIINMKRALQNRHLKTNEELGRDPRACDVITDILDDLATLLTTTTDYGNILRDSAMVCSTFIFYSSRGESCVSRRLQDMAVDAHNITLFVNRGKGGHRK
eukprot:jgi/Tetstr1/436368/TSEL_025201.t1